MRSGVIAQKVGMTRVFADDGSASETRPAATGAMSEIPRRRQERRVPSSIAGVSAARKAMVAATTVMTAGSSLLTTPALSPPGMPVTSQAVTPAV